VLVLDIEAELAPHGDQLDALDGFVDGIRRNIALADLIDRLLS
jgi:hypothetical protein